MDIVQSPAQKQRRKNDMAILDFDYFPVPSKIVVPHATADFVVSGS